MFGDAALFSALLLAGALLLMERHGSGAIRLPVPAILLVLLFAGAHAFWMFTSALPFQNILLAAAVCAGIGGMAGLILRQVVPGAAGSGITALLFIAAVLASRGTSKHLLVRKSVDPNYGLKIFGTTVALALLLMWGFQGLTGPVPTSFSSGGTSKEKESWGSLIIFAGWAIALMPTIAIATPTLIDKRAGKPLKASRRPALLWCALGILLLVDAGLATKWVTAGLLGAGVVVIAMGSRWNQRSELR